MSNIIFTNSFLSSYKSYFCIYNNLYDTINLLTPDKILFCINNYVLQYKYKLFILGY